MSAPNVQEIINAIKADLTVDYIDAHGARLPLPLAKEFVVRMQARPTLLKIVPVQQMEAQIEPVGPVGGFTGNALMLDVPGTSSTSANRVSLDISSQVLTAVNYKAVTELFFQVERENIIRMGIGNFVRERLAEVVALNVEKIALQGDTLSADTMLATNNGWIKQATTAGYTLDYSATPMEVNDYPFYLAMQTIDPAFLQNPADCMFLVHPRVEGAYAMFLQRARNSMGNRRSNPDYEGQLEFFGIAIRRCYNMPQGTIMLVPRSNLVVGFWLQMSLLTQTFVDPGFDLYVMRVAFDQKFVQPSGVCVLKGLESAIFPSGTQLD